MDRPAGARRRWSRSLAGSPGSPSRAPPSPGRSARGWCARSSSRRLRAGGLGAGAALRGGARKEGRRPRARARLRARDARRAGRLPHLSRGPVLARTRVGRGSRSFEGEPVTLFTHAIDCRGSAEPPPGPTRLLRPPRRFAVPPVLGLLPGREHRIYGDSGFHHDDWESEQLRLARPAPRPERALTTATTTRAGRPTGSQTPGSPTARLGSRPSHLLHLRRQPRRPRERPDSSPTAGPPATRCASSHWSRSPPPTPRPSSRSRRRGASVSGADPSTPARTDGAA